MCQALTFRVCLSKLPSNLNNERRSIRACHLYELLFFQYENLLIYYTDLPIEFTNSKTTPHASLIFHMFLQNLNVFLTYI